MTNAMPVHSTPRPSVDSHALAGIACAGAGRASTVTYLVPLFGVAWAWLLLGEAVTGTMLVAGLLIIGSVAFSQRAK